MTALQVVAAYRAKHRITTDAPLGPAAEEGSVQEAERQQAQGAYAHAVRAPPNWKARTRVAAVRERVGMVFVWDAEQTWER